MNLDSSKFLTAASLAALGLCLGCADMTSGGTDTTFGDTDTTPSGCTADCDSPGEDDPSALELIAAELSADRKRLTLTFNDELEPVDSVDPARFSVSMAFTYAYEHEGAVDDRSLYFEPNLFVNYEIVAPNQLSLMLEPGLDPEATSHLDELIMNPPIPNMRSWEGHIWIFDPLEIDRLELAAADASDLLDSGALVRDIQWRNSSSSTE